MNRKKTPKQMERNLKGIANHHRIEILLIIDSNEGLSLDGIVELIKGNTKTIGEHSRRLVQAGLINKHHNGKFVEHRLTPYGRSFVKFLKTFQNT